MNKNALCFCAALLLCAGTAESRSGASPANIVLWDASATVMQSDDTAWTLSKTGVVDATASTVTWTIAATQGATLPGVLTANGYLAVTNAGAGDANIGNIVVNLQTKSGSKWVTRSSDIADATSDDDATFALIEDHASSEGLSSFSENAASGRLLFMDASTNSVFALSPEKVIAPGQTVNLLFSAAFNNNNLHLANGTAVRVEVIVSFGNSGGNANNSSVNLDINGNGVVDASEHRIRSVPARLGGNVPSAQQGNTAVQISDAVSDIGTTGTVTFGSPVFNIGATSGTVRVSYDGGTDGGTITNCAHLTGSSSTTTQVGGFSFPVINGINMQACDSEDIAGSDGGGCTPGAPGCGWSTGDVNTYTQIEWGVPLSTAATLLSNQFFNIYSSGVFEVGLAGASGFSMRFSDGGSVTSYLPAVGPSGALNADLVDPTSTVAGAFGGEVTALQLNVDFADAHQLGGSANVALGDLHVCGTSVSTINGLRVRDVLAQGASLLGGGSAATTISALGPMIATINGAFDGGAPSTFAQQSLVNGTCS